MYLHFKFHEKKPKFWIFTAQIKPEYFEKFCFWEIHFEFVDISKLKYFGCMSL